MHLRHIVPNATRIRRLLEDIRKTGVADETVLGAIGRVPRELFVAQALGVEAYDDKCLPIGKEQTISMPSVVAKMTAALGLTGTEKVLEIGTGCGYQTAILCRLSKRVFTIERWGELSKTAVERLAAMGYSNFTPLVGDGTLGWPAQAPFDAIMVTAAGPVVPEALLSQLKPGGRLVAPVGELETYKGQEVQRLVRCVKQADGRVFTEDMGPVSFVPLVGAQGVAVVKTQRVG